MSLAFEIQHAAAKLLLPKPLAKRVRHRLRLRDADIVVVSFPKCGRTWVRVMLSKLYARAYGFADDDVIKYSNLHKKDPRVPKIYFTHDDSYKARPCELARDKSAYREKRLVYLARDPRDVIVSLYFHRTRRDRDLDMDMFEFVMGEAGGLRTVVEYYNIWASALEGMPDALRLRYEDMSADPVGTLETLAAFLAIGCDREAIVGTVEESSFERMKEAERKGEFRRKALQPADPDDDAAFKVRRGKVGGYRDYFTAQQLDAIDALVAKHLDPSYGYSGAASATGT